MKSGIGKNKEGKKIPGIQGEVREQRYKLKQEGRNVRNVVVSKSRASRNKTGNFGCKAYVYGLWQVMRRPFLQHPF